MTVRKCSKVIELMKKFWLKVGTEGSKETKHTKQLVVLYLNTY